ncbi:MAG TPA: mandelate racemase/muconate lactonizing enzyme family protein [Acetobacteraceae bacterium]|jgi:L-alanine-DL-glutamate epimerase-like enolase superfamily enzyme|nr:mandelate racemase/muconate lactonizing enzyme family protein [Acetobacteraceae bacterium]
MKITAIDTLRADAGWRMFSFLKITTDSGAIGWSEFSESFGSAGLGDVIEALGATLIGRDPRPSEHIMAYLNVLTRQARGGLNQQAIAAIENALLDIRGKDLGISVAALFGGPVRRRIPVYWSHMGSYRIRNAELVGARPLRGYDDVTRHAEEIRKLGFRAMKTNIMAWDGQALSSFGAGFGRSEGWPELNWSPQALRYVRDTLGALRAGAGPDVGVMLDTNFHFKTEGFRRVADAIAPYDLTWLEIDQHDAAALASIRAVAPCPIASCETLHGRREFKPFFEAYAMDVPIIDVVWNGLGESVKIAAMAEVYEMNVAPHNFYGHLCSVMSASLCAIVPNFRMMEIDIDSVAWRDEFFTTIPQIDNGDFVLPPGPGWGIEVNEAAVRARPPKG